MDGEELPGVVELHNDRWVLTRRGRLMAIQKKISARKLKARVGRRYTALLEGPSNESDMVWQARLEGMAPEIDGKVYITEIDQSLGFDEPEIAALAGRMVTVEITEAQSYDLVGRVVNVIGAPLEIPLLAGTAMQSTASALRILR